MSDKEIALRLIEKRGCNASESYLSKYFEYLEAIRNFKSKTFIGKLEELFYEYDHKSSYCEEDKNIFIDNVKKILLEAKGE